MLAAENARFLLREPAAHKGNFIEDLRKARWHIDRQIHCAGRWELDEQAAAQAKKEGV